MILVGIVAGLPGRVPVMIIVLVSPGRSASLAGRSPLLPLIARDVALILSHLAPVRRSAALYAAGTDGAASTIIAANIVFYIRAYALPIAQRVRAASVELRV
jgi:hypothetical protein